MAPKEPVGLLGCWLLGCGQKIIKVATPGVFLPNVTFWVGQFGSTSENHSLIV